MARALDAIRRGAERSHQRAKRSARRAGDAPIVGPLSLARRWRTGGAAIWFGFQVALQKALSRSLGERRSNHFLDLLHLLRGPRQQSDCWISVAADLGFADCPPADAVDAPQCAKS